MNCDKRCCGFKLTEFGLNDDNSVKLEKDNSAIEMVEVSDSEFEKNIEDDALYKQYINEMNDPIVEEYKEDKKYGCEHCLKMGIKVFFETETGFLMMLLLSVAIF